MLEASGWSDLETARSGDAQAAARLLEPLLHPGYRLALAILRRPEAAQDAVQDACFNALRSLSRFRGGPGGLRPWFLAIVTNACRSQMRRSWWRWSPLSDEVAAEDHAEGAAVRLDLARELGTLRPDQRAVLALFYYLDLPLPEVARVLGVSEPAARSRLYRAVGLLRQRLGEVEECP
ncbi:MAG: RNA polymerase sigma factor [Candidatus Dormiibacterota bacterium]